MRIYILRFNCGNATAMSSCKTRTIVVGIKYLRLKTLFTSRTENIKLLLDCSTIQMEKNICSRMCGIKESSRRRGFAEWKCFTLT